MAKIIGHRGARGTIQENTVASIKKAMEQKNIGEIEFDVHVTKDGIPILSHNNTVHNLAGKKFYVARHTLAELRQFTSGLATLREVLDMVDGRVPLLIEIKPRVPIAPIVDLIKKHLDDGWNPEHLAFCSFSQRTLLELNQALPAIRKVVNEDYSVFIGMYRARQLGTKHISMEQKYLWRAPMVLLTKLGYQVYSYTINDPRKAARLQKYGLAGIITDFPERYLSASKEAAPAPKTSPPKASPKRPKKRV